MALELLLLAVGNPLRAPQPAAMASSLLGALQSLRRTLRECPGATSQLRDALQPLAAAREAPVPSSLRERQALQA